MIGKNFVVTAFLHDQARLRAFDGAVDVATTQITGELQKDLTPEARAVLAGVTTREAYGVNAVGSRYAHN